MCSAYSHDADLAEHPELLVIPHLGHPADECVLPCIELDTGVNHQRTVNPATLCSATDLRMFASRSDMSRVRLSLFFICFSCSLFRNRAMSVFKGMETIMIATPTKAGQPRMLYSETKANVICILAVNMRGTDLK